MIEHITTFLIGIVYAGLVQKTISVALEQNMNIPSCVSLPHNENVGELQDINYTKCVDNSYAQQKKIDLYSLYFAMLISVITIVIAFILYKKNKYLSNGITLGSFIVITYNILNNWLQFNDKQRLLIYFITFISLCAITVKYFNINMKGGTFNYTI